jgi:hypothetical protein
MQLELPKPSCHSNHKTYTFPVSIGQPSSPPWLLHTPQPTMYWNHQPQLSRAKMALQLILTFKVNAIGTAKTFVSFQSQDFSFSCLHQPSRPPWLVHTPQPTTYWNHQPQLSRAKMALQLILTIKVNAIGTAKTFVSLQLQDFHFLSQYQPSSPLWLVHTPQPTMYWNHQPQLSRLKIALQFILSIKVNAIGTAKTFVSLQSQYFLFLSPSAFQSPVIRPYTKEMSPPYHLSS